MKRILFFKLRIVLRHPIRKTGVKKLKGTFLIISTALNHVHLETKYDSMEIVKQRASVLQSLCEKGFIKISYKVFITVQSDYAMYEVSDIFLSLHQLVEQGKTNPHYLFDIPYIKPGQVMLTENGQVLCRTR